MYHSREKVVSVKLNAVDCPAGRESQGKRRSFDDDDCAEVRRKERSDADE